MEGVQGAEDIEVLRARTQDILLTAADSHQLEDILENQETLYVEELRSQTQDILLQAAEDNQLENILEQLPVQDGHVENLRDRARTLLMQAAQGSELDAALEEMHGVSRTGAGAPREAATPAGLSLGECQAGNEGSQFYLSPRARTEASLVDALPNREFELDENGRVVQELPPAGVRADMNLGARAPEDIDSMDAWRSMRQEVRLLQTVRAQLVARGFNPHESAVDGNAGSEPPPTPHSEDIVNTKKQRANGFSEIRYRSICENANLKANPRVCDELRKLDLGESVNLAFRENMLGNRGARALFDAISVSAPADGHASLSGLAGISHLDLRSQGLGNEAAAALCKLLPLCPGLSEVDLSWNNISETGAKSLVRTVGALETITQLNLDSNQVPSRIRVSLKHLLANRN